MTKPRAVKTSPRPRRAGFTLLEMMGVIVVMAIVLGFATDFYIDLSRASNRASEHTSEIRRATAVLDRIARDLESTILLVKAPEADPLEHPWLFVAETRHAQAGADHLKFVTRNFQSRRRDAHESDLAMVAYSFSPSETDSSYELFRWSSSQLPESLDRTFPDADADANFLLADGIADFGLTFTDDQGETSDSWDSTTLVQSGALPVWVEISIAMADPNREDGIDVDFEAEDLVYYRRRVHLPVRPIDLAAMLNPNAGGATGEESGSEGGAGNLSGKTVGECLDLAALAASTPGGDSDLRASLSQPWASMKPFLPPSFRRFVLSKPGCQ